MVFEGRVVAVQVPVAAFDRFLHLRLGFAHACSETMVDTGGVGDDEGRSGIGFGFGDGFEGLGLVGSHGDLGDVDVAIAHGHHAKVFFPGSLAAGSKLGDSGSGGGFGALAAGVGVDFGVHDEDVDVFAGGKDMVQAAVADVIGPAVAAEDPLRPFDEVAFEAVDFVEDRIIAFGGFQSGGEFFGPLSGAFALVFLFEPVFDRGFQVTGYFVLV